MTFFRTLIVGLFCTIILPSNAQDIDYFAGIDKELSSILKKNSKSSRILKTGSKSSRIPRKAIKWNIKKICKQFNMIFANMCPSDIESCDTIIIVRKSQEYLYLGEDDAFFVVKCLPGQQYYQFKINNASKNVSIISGIKDIPGHDRFSCIINLAQKDSASLFNNNSFGTVYADNLYLYSICMMIKRDGTFRIKYYRTLGQELLLRDRI